MEYLPCFYAFGCCMAFCVALHVRGAAMFWTSLGGALGWFVYVLCAPLQNDILQYFFGTLALAVYAEVMARVRRSPATGYLHVALLPMVPGGGIYYTMEYGIAGNTEMFLETGMHTLGIAGARNPGGVNACADRGSCGGGTSGAPRGARRMTEFFAPFLTNSSKI